MWSQRTYWKVLYNELPVLAELKTSRRRQRPDCPHLSLVWRSKSSLWHSKPLLPNLYHTWLPTLKRDLCVEKISYAPVYFCRLNAAPKEMPILPLALKNLQKKCVTLISTVKKTAAPAEKESAVFC